MLSQATESTEVHATITCYDERLDPIIQHFESSLRLCGHTVIHPVRPVGGIHAMTHSPCRDFFYSQLDGLIEIGQATHIHLFPHTGCQFNQLKQWEKISKSGSSDITFQINTLKKVREGGQEHLVKKYPHRDISLDVRIILTDKRRIIDLEEAERILKTYDL